MWANDGEAQSASGCMDSHWVRQIAQDQDNKVMLSAESMHKHPLLKKDHMVSSQTGLT